MDEKVFMPGFLYIGVVEVARSEGDCSQTLQQTNMQNEGGAILPKSNN